MIDRIPRTIYREVPVHSTDTIQKETFGELVTTEYRDVPVYGFDLIPDTIYEKVPREIVDIV